MRAMLRIACFAAMVAGGIWPIFGLFRKPEPVPTTADRARAEHAGLQCFAEKVLRATPPGATIRFDVPNRDSDGGLIDHRLRYVLPGRYVVTAGRADYAARWRSACDGDVVRQ